VETSEPLYFENGEQWRDWLESNYKTVAEAWLFFYKKGVAKHGLTYQEALGEALNFGWIDTKLKSLGGEKYMLRYVRRKPGSAWS
jgi:uncharacterized protein YdeI (YjbR/CyaY-like superfamily)